MPLNITFKKKSLNEMSGVLNYEKNNDKNNLALPLVDNA